jgi:hypothetical protein
MKSGTKTHDADEYMGGSMWIATIWIKPDTEKLLKQKQFT